MDVSFCSLSVSLVVLWLFCVFGWWLMVILASLNFSGSGWVSIGVFHTCSFSDAGCGICICCCCYFASRGMYVRFLFIGFMPGKFVRLVDVSWPVWRWLKAQNMVSISAGLYPFCGFLYMVGLFWSTALKAHMWVLFLSPSSVKTFCFMVSLARVAGYLMCLSICFILLWAMAVFQRKVQAHRPLLLKWPVYGLLVLCGSRPSFAFLLLSSSMGLLSLSRCGLLKAQYVGLYFMRLPYLFFGPC